jgi:predicted glycosyltransferase
MRALQAGGRLRVVFYAVNGTGVGHLVRQLAIARWMRRYATLLDTPLEAWFLTSSEADGMVFSEGFAAFKIPSKTIVADARLDRRAYLALAKQFVWQTLGLLRPDLLVVDTFPRGSFGELLSALDLCRHAVFVHRPVKREIATRPDFQAMLPLYDAIVVPEHEAELYLPDAVRDRVTMVGPVLSRERCELLPRAEARARLGVDDRPCVYVSAGGGGDRGAEAHLHRVIAALRADPGLAIVVGPGPLYRGRPVPGATTLPGNAAESMAAFDAAVCAAGYNTFGELMFAGVPTAFIPQEKLADDQAARAARAVAAGAARLLGPGEDVSAAVAALLADPGARAAARATVPDNCARAAAAEILRVVHGEAAIDPLEAALDDRRLGAARRIDEAEVFALAARLRRHQRGGDAAALDGAIRLVEGRLAETRELRGLVDAVARLRPADGVAAHVDQAAATLAALGPLVGGEGAAARAAAAEGLGDATLAEAIRARVPA